MNVREGRSGGSPSRPHGHEGTPAGLHFTLTLTLLGLADAFLGWVT